MKTLLIRMALTIVVGFCFVCLAFVVWFGTYGIFGPCGEEDIALQKSPDGQVTAHLFTRDCGATTPVAIHLVLESQGIWNQSRRVFVADHLMAEELEWMTPNKLRVLLSETEDGRIFTQEYRWRDVEIYYEAINTPTPSARP